MSKKRRRRQEIARLEALKQKCGCWVIVDRVYDGRRHADIGNAPRTDAAMGNQMLKGWTHRLHEEAAGYPFVAANGVIGDDLIVQEEEVHQSR